MINKFSSWIWDKVCERNLFLRLVKRFDKPESIIFAIVIWLNNDSWSIFEYYADSNRILNLFRIFWFDYVKKLLGIEKIFRFIYWYWDIVNIWIRKLLFSIKLWSGMEISRITSFIIITSFYWCNIQNKWKIDCLLYLEWFIFLIVIGYWIPYQQSGRHSWFPTYQNFDLRRANPNKK